MWKKLKSWCKTIFEFLLNPRFLLCFGLGWMITNGWSYLMLGLGIYTDTGWMVAVPTTYLAFLWMPFTPEKIITIAIALGLMRWLFPKDEKTLGKLHDMHEKAKAALKGKKKKKVKK